MPARLQARLQALTEVRVQVLEPGLAQAEAQRAQTRGRSALQHDIAAIELRCCRGDEAGIYAYLCIRVPALRGFLRLGCAERSELR